MGTSALVMRSNGVNLFFFLIGLLPFCRTSPMTGEDLPEDSKNEIMAIDGMEVSDSGELYFHGEKVKSIQGMGGENYTGHERKKRSKRKLQDNLSESMDSEIFLRVEPAHMKTRKYVLQTNGTNVTELTEL